jgi:predicted TPR repeat methyltransferase
VCLAGRGGIFGEFSGEFFEEILTENLNYSRPSPSKKTLKNNLQKIDKKPIKTVTHLVGIALTILSLNSPNLKQR